MTTALKGKSVVVQQAIDEAIYFVDGEIKYEAVLAENEEGDAGKVTVWVVFTPTNGHNKGQLHRVPISRVISVIGNSS
jgi:hypothetical protein